MATEPPAYKQFWPWFLFGLPGIVVVAGLTTWYIAARYADHLVVDDYYKDGLAINEVLRKQQLAEKLAIRAELTVQGNLAQVHLTNSADAAALQLDPGGCEKPTDSDRGATSINPPTATQLEQTAA